MKTEQLSSWLAIGAIIGKSSLEAIIEHDILNQARMVIAIMLDEGYTLTTDGSKVYTSMVMQEKVKIGWQALQPALIRVINE